MISLLWNLNKITEQKINETDSKYREETCGCHRGGWWEDGKNRSRVLKSTNFQLQSK